MPQPTLRPPAVPLVTVDPFINAWSTSDRLYDDWPRHWTGACHALHGAVRVDGLAYRFLGGPAALQRTADQRSVTVFPTRTVYLLRCGPIDLELTFTAPLLLDDLELMSRPVTYISYRYKANDGRSHDVQLYFDASGEWAVAQPLQEVTWERGETERLRTLSIASVAQNMLAESGDEVCMDWGRLYLAAPKVGYAAVSGEAATLRQAFVDGVSLPQDDLDPPRAANSSGGPVLAVISEPVEAATGEGHLLLAYDDGYSLEYFGQRLRPWWRRGENASAEAMLDQAEGEYAQVMARCEAFDHQLVADLERVGGPHYQQLCSLAYRQAISAHKLVAGPEGQVFFASKENDSNGCIWTVDVTYPSIPLFLLFNSELVKGMIEPICDYCRSDAWPYPFAAHDLGQYPLANGQVYGRDRGLAGQMPVEECGNMLIIAAAIAAVDGGPSFARKHWDVLSQWADYLAQEGLDPGNQLCTDDFAGHLAHNANLSIKAIVALGAYGQLARRLGQEETARRYLDLAAEFATQWPQMAADGDHYRLAFDQADTWSQKYNLVWDRLLGLNLFDPEIACAEVAHYLRVQNAYGLPLDSRRDYTKSDWVMWTAVLAEDEADFRALIEPLWRYAHETPSRVPLSDWHDTVTSEWVSFRARSVVGGYYMKLLAERLTGASNT